MLFSPNTHLHTSEIWLQLVEGKSRREREKKILRKIAQVLYWDREEDRQRVNEMKIYMKGEGEGQEGRKV